ncbi:uncharacterized protein LOC126707068 [Quercus robur]|uniref:uncharacterized protein LOC126707068 n=1 Tax=Quercus robur TaxID=38942 RepID=UPI0021612A12|nr:uncharacterized protein LOC126707068 [Quercus robur]
MLKSDSKLVIEQVRGDYEAKETRMQKYLKLTNQLASNFHRPEFVWIPRDQNAEADEVARNASADDQDKINDWRLEEPNSPSIKEFQTFPVHTYSGWTSPILSFLRDLPPNPEEAKKIQKRAARFTVLNDELYKRGFSQPYLRCIEEEEARYVLEEVHRGVCEDHVGPKSFVRKIMRAGYFWPMMQQDAVDFVKRCDSCQRFRIPRTIISDNGRQFDSHGFRSFCSSLGIKNKYSSPGHPQANGQTKVTNRTLLKIIKFRLVGAKGAWLKELPSVLWAYRMTTRTPTGETPFNLTYNTETVILVEVGLTSLRREFFDEQCNDDQLRLNLDYLDEVRNQASQRMSKY